MQFDRNDTFNRTRCDTLITQYTEKQKPLQNIVKQILENFASKKVKININKAIMKISK